MDHVIPSWDLPSLAVAGSEARFPVRRIFCAGRNYVEHQKEMGGDGRELPFFFCKSAHDLVPLGESGDGAIHYPPMTHDYHWETELVAVLGRGGFRIGASEAYHHVWGYAVGLDMTRRDLQGRSRAEGRPWCFGKDFDEAAPVGAVHPSSRIGHPTKAKIWLKVNDEFRQRANIADMVWTLPEQIAFLSQYYHLEAGDIIMTGTPAGVGAAEVGDFLLAGIDGLGELSLLILPPRS